MHEHSKHVVSAALAEATKMKAAVHGASEDGRVDMSVRQFSTLALLIEQLCLGLPHPDIGSFGNPRYWVPLDVFIKSQESNRLLKSECASLRAELQHRI